MDSLMQFEGKNVVVTGAYSGIGAPEYQERNYQAALYIASKTTASAGRGRIARQSHRQIRIQNGERR